MPLTHWTIEALQHKAEVAEDESSFDGADACWDEIARACQLAIETGTLNELAMDELMNYADNLEGDSECRTELRAIRTDLCRAGFYEVHDPNAVTLGGKRRPMKVDGVLFDV